MIIKYATDIKGKNVGYKYITTIAKNWSYAGVKTAEQVEEKLLELEKNTGLILEVLKELGFLHNDLLLVAKTLKRRGGMLKLDGKITNYYNNKLLSIKEIEEYEKQKDLMFETAKTITKTLGLYYQDLSSTIEVYVTEWLQKGFDPKTLTIVANYCFKRNIRTLDGMNNIIDKFYKLGLVSLESINQYIGKAVKSDNEIKEILEKCGLTRNITSWDRDFYRTWTYSWNTNKDLILYAGELSKDKANPVKYMNSILSNWHINQVNTLQKAKENSQPIKETKKTEVDFRTRSYSNEELNSLFDNLDEVDI